MRWIQRYVPKRFVKRVKDGQMYFSSFKQYKCSIIKLNYDGSKLNEFIDLIIKNGELMDQWIFSRDLYIWYKYL